jgi:hypothetical protein
MVKDETEGSDFTSLEIIFMCVLFQTISVPKGKSFDSPLPSPSLYYLFPDSNFLLLMRYLTFNPVE